MIADDVNAFVELARNISELRELTTPAYKDCAKGLYCICKMLLRANENILRWYFLFTLFNFEDKHARTKINDLIRDYKTLKGNNLRELKFSCGDFGRIYKKNIESKFGSLFTERHKTLGRIFGKPATLEESKQLIERLGEADRGMVSYVKEKYLDELDRFVDDIEAAVDMKELPKAERRRLEFKIQMKDTSKQLDDLNNNLAALVEKFANLAGTPVTLPSENECLKEILQQR